MFVQKHLEIIGILFLAVSILCFINGLLVIIRISKQHARSSEEKKQKNNDNTPIEIIGFIIHIGSMLLFYGSWIYIINTYKSVFTYIVIMIFSLGFVFQYAVHIIPSTKRLGTIIIGNTNDSEMDIRDFSSIVILALISVMLYEFKIIDKIVAFAQTCNSIVVGDFILAVTLFTSMSICILFICSLAIFPLQAIANIIQKGKKGKSEKILNRIEQKARKAISEQVSTKTLTEALKLKIQSKSIIIQKVLLSFLYLPVLIIDILFIFVLQIVYLFESILCYIFLLLRQITDVIYNINKWILSLSVKTVIAIAFRVAIIFGLIYTVGVNRYSPIFRNDEESTAVTEFIASSIIIPLILEWLLSFRPQWKKSIEENKREL